MSACHGLTRPTGQQIDEYNSNSNSMYQMYAKVFFPGNTILSYHGVTFVWSQKWTIGRQFSRLQKCWQQQNIGVLLGKEEETRRNAGAKPWADDGDMPPLFGALWIVSLAHPSHCFCINAKEERFPRPHRDWTAFLSRSTWLSWLPGDHLRYPAHIAPTDSGKAIDYDRWRLFCLFFVGFKKIIARRILRLQSTRTQMQRR